MVEGLSYLIVLVLLAAFAFWLGRELILWYWRITEAIGILAEIRDDIKSIRSQREGERRAADARASGIEYGNSRLKIPEAVKPVFKD